MSHFEDHNMGLPLCSDDSYKSGQVEGFDNSRAGGLAAFKGVSLGGATSQAAGDANLLINAVPPADFSFLLSAAGSRNGTTKAEGEDASMASFPPRDSFSGPPPVKKRGRMDDGPDSPILPPWVSAVAEASGKQGKPTAPVIQPRPQEVLFGKVEGEERGEKAMDPPVKRTDVFAWLRDDSQDKDPEIMDLLAEENAYSNGMQQHLEALRSTLYNEMLAHQREADVSCKTLYPGGYEYYTKTFVGKSYQVHYRRRASAAADGAPVGTEEMLLDENDLATDPEDGSQRPFCSVTGPFGNPMHTQYVCGTDFTGSDEYTLRMFPGPPRARDQWSSLEIERTDGSVHWGALGECFYYVALDPEFRPAEIRRHNLGQDPAGLSDQTIWQEDDKKFSVSLDESSCRRYIIATVASSETSEVHLLDLKAPGAGLQCVAQRAFGHRYSVDHCGGMLYILTSKDNCKNSKLCRVPISALPDASLDVWEDIWMPTGQLKLESHHCFERFIALEARHAGECKIFIQGYGDGEDEPLPLHAITFPDVAAHTGRVLTPRGMAKARAAFCAGLADNPIFETQVIRYNYTSFTVPPQTFEYDVRSKSHRLIWQQPVPDYDPALYQAEQIRTRHRGVPVSVVYRKDLHPEGLAGGPFPTVLTGYGAYGCCQDPDFDGNRLSLLDRGVIYAVAHVRGGGELGRSWYEEGRYLSVKNRFADFVDAAEELISLHITVPQQLSAWGTSSGGLLVTASMNLRPDLFHTVLLQVPFVDVLNTMCDPSVPLTVGEWEEIGNPNEKEYFYYQLEYSPYDNLRMESYPSALVTASLNDSMVGYWEPLKYVAKLRMLRTNRRPSLLRVNFHAGHSGAQDRYESLREAAFEFAFLLGELGLAERRLLASSGAPR